ncbi:hypothetical protein MPDQ_002634 [Monascus purpureus]|uniref:Uncharacterized protein n=1 Tax=Monascus purpureus TaxID=5098 RepID=A0A507QK64_MONPU|nr:hypothetical protein MPDQ_002634 [Monascus purpureus]
MLKIIVLLSVHRDSGFQPNVIRTLDIPMAKESVEVLEFIGFMPGAARLIYDRYLNRPNPDQNPDDRIAYVSGHIAALKSSRHGGTCDAIAVWQGGHSMDVTFKTIQSMGWLRRFGERCA